MTAMAQAAPAQTASARVNRHGRGRAWPGSKSVNALGGAGMAASAFQVPASEPPRRFPAHYLWAVLIARIYEVFPLVRPMCGGNVLLIAFITVGAQIRNALEHIGVPAQASRIAPARGPPLWDDCDAQGADDAGQGARIEQDWGESTQAARSISALIGERAIRQRTRAVGRAAPVELPSAAKCSATTDASSRCDALCSCRRWGSGDFEDPHGCDTWAHGVELPFLLESLVHKRVDVVRDDTARQHSLEGLVHVGLRPCLAQRVLVVEPDINDHLDRF